MKNRLKFGAPLLGLFAVLLVVGILGFGMIAHAIELDPGEEPHNDMNLGRDASNTQSNAETVPSYGVSYTADLYTIYSPDNGYDWYKFYFGYSQYNWVWWFKLNGDTSHDNCLRASWSGGFTGGMHIYGSGWSGQQIPSNAGWVYCKVWAMSGHPSDGHSDHTFKIAKKTF